MRRLRAWTMRLGGFMFPERREREMQRELESHLQLHVDDNIRAGMTPAEARRHALLKFGPMESIKEACRERSRLPRVERLLGDVRFGLRRLRREPAFATAVVLTLALGIGVNTAVFSVVDPVLLRPLPYPEPERIIQVNAWGQAFAEFGDGIQVSPPELRHHTAFTAVGLFIAGGVNVGGHPAVRLPAAEVTPEFFRVLNVPPVRGRWFTDTDIATSDRIAVIGAAVWRQRFQSDPDVIGKSITLDSLPFTVVGVMPEGVSFPDGASIWVPTSAPTHISGFIPSPKVVARLQPGVSPADARTVVLSTAKVSAKRADRVTVVPLRDVLVGKVRAIALIVWVAATLVLLVACMNAANLLLARVSSREREFVVRRALGATPVQLIRQVVTEGLVLAVVAGVIAVPAALWPLQAAKRLLPANLHGAVDIGIGGRTLAATAGVALATTLLFALAPAFSVKWRTPVGVLRADSTTTHDRFWGRFRSVLVSAQVALAVVLLVGAATLVASVRATMSVDLGVRSERALVFEVSLPGAKYSAAAQKSLFYERLFTEVRAVHGVEEVGATDHLPGRAGIMLARPIVADGHQPPEDTERAVLATASPRYFAATGIDLLAGRFFTERDRPGAPRVVIVSESYAKALGTRPEHLIGARTRTGTDKGPRIDEIVGVVRDVRFRDQDDYKPVVYVPHATDSSGTHAYLVVRAASESARLVPDIRSAIARVDPDLPLFNVQTYDELREGLIAERRFAMTTMVLFAVLAFSLAAIGLYGVISYLVQLRTREIGIRLAVGAPRKIICRQILLSGFAHAAGGVGLGIALVLGVGRILESRLWLPGVAAVSPAVLVGLAAVVLAVAVAATLLPAWRAIRIDPALTLRAE